MLGHEEAPHIAQHHQDVLVHGVDVKQVMLHLTHDATKRPQVAAQHRGLVHQANGVGHAARRLQNAHEHVAVGRVCAEFAIHQLACVVERTQGARRQPIDTHGGFKQPEGFQNRVWVIHIHIVAGDFEHARFVCKAFVDGAQGLCVACQTLFNVEKQNLVELRDRFGGPVVALHQGFAGHAGIERTVFFHA